MTTQPTRRPISKGICTFCKAEVVKNKMTQHLKSCKQRLASIASQEEKSQDTKTRLFHILAEGQYNPQYWLHFEVPASESLWSIDDFLKAMWIDDLDHLSGFEINGTNYSDTYADDFSSYSIKSQADFASEEEDIKRDEQAKISRLIDEATSGVLRGQFAGRTGIISIDFSAWVSELRKPRSTDDLVDYLKEELLRTQKEEKRAHSPKEEMSEEEASTVYLTAYYQKRIVRDLLDAIEDRSMDVLLGRVLKVDRKFSYVYDFGSSTYINLRVIAEREGIVQDKKNPVQLLAKNTAKTFACVICGMPATKVTMGYYYGGIEGNTYCDVCAKKQDDEEFRPLPIINSPRVGVL
jgi:hypothetical protein